MTNEYGSDSQPQSQDHDHDEHAAAQEVPAHEGEPGVWTDDQPPHDDFGAANEETATVSQEAATDAEHEEAAVTETRQSRSMLPILAGLGGILLLGVVMYLQFGHSSPPEPPLHLVSSAPAQKATDLPSAAPPPSEPAGNPTENDINALYKPAGTPTQVTMPPASTAIETTPGQLPTSATPPTAVPTTPTTSTTSMAAAPEIAPKSAASTLPNLASPPLAQGNPSNPVPPLPGQVLHPTGTATNGLTSSMPAGSTNTAGDPQQISRMNALAARIDTLQKSVDQVSNMVAAVPGMTNHPDTNVDNRLNKIEQTLMKLESDEATKGSKQASSSTSSEEAPRVSHSTRTSSTKHKHTHTKTASSSIHHRPSSTVSSSGSMNARSQWVLRAATPKEAWVSNDPNSPDLRHVQIGESLPGVGVVRSIRQANGGWEIEGSTGIVR